jgi:hypothetical protein
MCDWHKIKNLKVKNGVIQDIKACTINTKTINGSTGTFSYLSADNLLANNLNVQTLNGVDFNCLKTITNISGIITPVVYINGVPQQPNNPGDFNQEVLDELWNLNKLAVSVTNLDAAYGRLRSLILNNFYGCPICPSLNETNCNCPIPSYAVFIGSITGNILNVTSLLDTSYTSCPPSIGNIQVGQRIYGQTTKFLSSLIISQISGNTGGIGTYTIRNNFDNYSQIVEPQTILSISDLGLEECGSVPLLIYGVETLSVGPLQCNQILSAISYNINIANKTLSSKLAAVYVQFGYQNGSGPVNIQGFSIDTKQFDNSIVSFGEQMNNNILLPTELIGTIATLNRNSSIVNAVVQLVVYVEDGLEVFIPEIVSAAASMNASVNFTASQNSSNYGVSFVSTSCADSIAKFTGTIQPFIQPEQNAVVTVTFSSNSMGDIINFFPLSVFFGNNWYITTRPAFIDGSLNLINIGDTPPGTLISGPVAIFQGNVGTMAADSSIDNTQLSGFTVTVPFNIVDMCVNSLINNAVALVTATAAGSMVAGIYVIASITKIADNVYNVELENVRIYNPVLITNAEMFILKVLSN